MKLTNEQKEKLREGFEKKFHSYGKRGWSEEVKNSRDDVVVQQIADYWINIIETMGEKECETCNGTGVVLNSHFDTDMLEPDEMTCPDCSKSTETERCSECISPACANPNRGGACGKCSETEGEKLLHYCWCVHGIKITDHCSKCVDRRLREATPKQSWEERFDEKFVRKLVSIQSDVTVEEWKHKPLGNEIVVGIYYGPEDIKSFIKEVRQEAVEEERERVVGEIEKLIKKHKQRACNIARSSEYDPTNMPSNVENPLVRSLVFSNIDIVRELEDIKNLLTK